MLKARLDDHSVPFWPYNHLNILLLVCMLKKGS